MKVSARKIYIDAQHGLGNRLRAIASGASMAQKTGRDLVIVWQADNHCGADFADLFDYEGPVLAEALYGRMPTDVDFYNYMEVEPNSAKDAPVSLSEEKDLYVRTSCVVNSDLSDWALANQFLRDLTPSRAIRDLLEPFQLNNHVGVHIRMELGEGESVANYEDDSFLSRESFDTAQYWRKKSHFKVFIDRLDRLFAEDPECRVFVASDRDEAYQALETTFGDRVTYLRRSAFDRSKAQICYALADAILLSRCKGLIGSSWSSFTELAMRLAPAYDYVEMSGRDF